LEERLLDQLIRGVEPDVNSPVSLDIVDGYVTSTFECLKDYRVPVVAEIEQEVINFTAGVAPNTALNNASGVLSVVRTAAAQLRTPSNPPTNYVPLIYNNANSFQAPKSIFFLFNELLFKYINMSFDPAAQKIYRKCLDNIAGGTFSDSITDPAINSYDDNAHVLSGVVPLTPNAYDPATIDWTTIDRRVMTSTNAYIMRHLLNTTTQQAQPAFVVQDLADVPNHMKERFRANYPFVIKCADTLIRRCDLVRNCIASGVVSGGNTGMLIKIVSRISQGLFSLRNSAADVLKELDDQPKYLEVSQGMLDYHRGLYGGIPLMPLSSTSCLLANLTAPGDSENSYFNYVQLPFSTQGTTSFKFRYGTRQLLGRPESAVSLDHMPWMKESLQAYNGVSDAKFQIEESQLTSYLQCHVELLRYFADSRHIRSLMILGGMPSVQPVVGDNSAVTGAPFGIHHQAGQKVHGVYSLQDRRLFSDVLAMTESSFSQQKRMELAQAITDSSIALNRRDIAVRNLLDLNIVPLNIRALMREVVLINLYNYSYTFDQMVMDLFGYHPSSPLATDSALIQVPSSELRNPKDVFVRLLINPYQNLDMATYYMNVPFIMAGMIGNQMGRPKFVGDQFYNKALLGELYPNVNTYITYDGQQTYHDPGVVGPQSRRPGVAADKGYGLGPGPARIANKVASTAISQRNLSGLLTGIFGTPLAGGPPQATINSWSDAIINIQNKKPKSGSDLLSMIGMVSVANTLDRDQFMGILLADLLYDVMQNRLTDDDLNKLATDLYNFITRTVTGNTVESIYTGANLTHKYKYLSLVKDMNVVGARLRNPYQVNIIQQALRDFVPFARKVDTSTSPTTFFRGEMMTYIKDSARNYADRVGEVSVGPNYRQALKVVGKMRFDTKLTRNLLFVIMCQRTMRLKLHQELSWNKRIASGATLVDESFTEIDNDRSSTDPNEVKGQNGRYKL
jgi:hypothetical protein